MRYAVIADVHANLEALNAVLEAIKKEKVDELLFLGDSIGYGPNPNECIEILKDKAKILLAGNHDWAAVGLTDIEYFNPYARVAIEWTAEVLSDSNKNFLKALPLTERLQKDSIFLVHSTPKEPAKWHYLLSTQDAHINFCYFPERICFLGHSHEPFIIEQSPKGKMLVYREKTEIRDNFRYIINVGSVGQPRDGNPDAAYAIFHENSIEIKRAAYDIASTQKKMRASGLPSPLIERLSIGV